MIMKRHIITEDATIIEALDKLNALSGGVMTLVSSGPSQGS